MSTLYEDIGGEQALQKAVREFYAKVLADPRLNGYFDGVDVARLQRSQVAVFASALGARGSRPRQRSGDHIGRGIDHGEFDLVLCHLADALRAAGVPDERMTEVLLTIAPLARDLVGQVSPQRTPKVPAQRG